MTLLEQTALHLLIFFLQVFVSVVQRTDTADFPLFSLHLWEDESKTLYLPAAAVLTAGNRIECSQDRLVCLKVGLHSKNSCMFGESRGI